MRHRAVRALALLAATGLVAVAPEARAAAMAGVHNVFSVSVSEYQPLTPEQRAQIGIAARLVGWSSSEILSGNSALTAYYELAGSTAPGGWGSSEGGAFLQAMARANENGHAAGSYTVTVAIDVTNGTGMDLPYVVLGTWYSSYAPDLSAGARVDRAPLEYALFDTSQSGDGIGGGHGCDTRNPGDPSHYLWDTTPPTIACGVSSPDHSLASAALWDLKAGQTGTLEYTLSLTVEAFSVPEPATLALLAPAVLGLPGLRRRRAR